MTANNYLICCVSVEWITSINYLKNLGDRGLLKEVNMMCFKELILVFLFAKMSLLRKPCLRQAGLIFIDFDFSEWTQR